MNLLNRIFCVCGLLLPATVSCGTDDDGSDDGSAGGAGSGGAGTGGTTSSGGARPEDGGGEPLDESLRTPCTTHCNGIFSVRCENDEGSLDHCVSGCMLVGSDPECGASFEAWLDCALETPLGCNAAGEARPLGCQSEEDALAACYGQT
jgi:hypothetical protein